MFKRCFILIVVFCTFISLASCGIDYRFSLDQDSHNLIECVWEENDSEPSYIIYKDQKYMLAKKTEFISIDKCVDDVLISWNGSRYFGYVDEYHSYTTENPIFIY